MPPLSPVKGGLQSILANQATLGAVEGSNPNPGSSKGSIPRPFQRPHLSIHMGHIKAAGYPLEAGPSPSKKAKALVSKSRPKTPSVTQKAKFANDVGVTPSASINVYHPLAGSPPHSIPRASALELIAMPINPLLDP
ncbi:hypothetical protein PAXRUDRAFT_22289 [Paxillus rubicundulus Ve08.2h10]|uniref:Uncharacterized protein n=1 Tax=Paxillus rubicundulus Ve08.2h10 TaxID=930991 RepID=A0A0D0CXP3_9AGAM|nr:hypothetical protein PAXRUDRAFT_22289 [Paxillus rubicundulus Ve08.2h10]